MHNNNVVQAPISSNTITEDLPVKLTSAAYSSAGVASLVALATNSCGGGGSGASSGGGIQTSSTASSVAPQLLYTKAEAARFLLQTQFTATDEEILAVRTSGYDAWLTTQFNSAIDQTGAQWLTASGHATPKKDGNYFNPVFGDWMAWNQLLTGTGQVRKRLSLALSEFFVVSLNPIDGFWPPMLIAGYWDLLNAKVFDNFRNLLEDISLNPAMGFYLNTKGNLKEDAESGRQPDENYAREIMQLFSIGLYELNLDGSLKTNAQGNPIETYVQSDITNLARVFTGYDWDYSKVTQQHGFESYPVPTPEFTSGRMAFDAKKHSNLAVSFLGTNIPANTSGADALRIALDTLFNHANTGPFFAKQMIQRLITSNPSPAYIQRVATVFNNNGANVRGDLKAVWRAILTDTEARTLPSNNTAGKLREPIVRLTQIARTFNVSSTNGKWEIYDLSNADTGLGQAPLRSPSVFNFFRPGYVPPNTALASQGLLAPEFQLHNETSTAGYINMVAYFIKSGYADVKVSLSAIESLATDAKALVEWLNLHLTANQLSAATLDIIQQALEANPVTASSSSNAKNDRLYAAILLVAACPEYLIQK
ncbi:hypothetical protein GCM10011613_22020 [Cellvibrio zantedeschiae]|uniref:DUF1800 domain-containing protein n=1 Tax=Cellvibrio zantedeschiae TaxID=1237077 RepID=A0ABQ3B3G4_9GAMM|nr:DUF1800 domain-containing protein [Cellvibrio zantedeschiae]GGY77101.1 hypothetical protein GCM10011613_22020 [Cellvibrio zantedeschiae]